MSANRVGRVLSLFISEKESKQRVVCKEITLDEKGILGDKFYDKEIQRSVLLTSNDSYHLARENSVDIEEGLLGENILMDYNPYKLSAGTQIKIGAVILQISQNCTICNHLASVDKRLPRLLKHDRGIFARVIVGGTIKKGDSIMILEEIL